MTKLEDTRIRGFEVVPERFRKFPNDEIKLPRRATKNSMAYDFYAVEDRVIRPGETYIFATDVCAYMESTTGLVINTRSGNGIKKHVVLSNSQGWIDSDYYGNESNGGAICIALDNNGEQDFIVKKYDRIAQGMFVNYLIADNDNPISQERIGGLGSSGNC